MKKNVCRKIALAAGGISGLLLLLESQDPRRLKISAETETALVKAASEDLSTEAGKEALRQAVPDLEKRRSFYMMGSDVFRLLCSGFFFLSHHCADSNNHSAFAKAGKVAKSGAKLAKKALPFIQKIVK